MQNSGDFKHVESFLSKINPMELTNKIKKFRALNFNKISDDELVKEIYNVLCVNDSFIYITNTGTYTKDTDFFRVRRLKDSMIPPSNLKAESDFWNPPEEYVKNYGRINKPHESLLYTSPINQNICIEEMKIATDELFAMIKYKSKDDVKVNIIGGEYDYDKIEIFDETARLVNEMYNNFLRDEFSRDVGKGTEFLYKISEIIAKHFFDLPPRIVQDAWAYPSIQSKPSYNVCFRPDIAHELLELQGAAICRLAENNNIIALAVAHGFDQNGLTQLYKIGSVVQMHFFPELSKKS